MIVGREIALFTTGRHKEEDRNWTLEDLYTLADRNKDKNIPIVINHTESNLPIVGFLSKNIYVKDGILWGVVEEFAENWVEFLKELDWTKISLSIRLDTFEIVHAALVVEAAVEILNDKIAIYSKQIKNYNSMTEEQLKALMDSIEALKVAVEEIKMKLMEEEEAETETETAAEFSKVVKSENLVDHFNEKTLSILEKISKGDYSEIKLLADKDNKKAEYRADAKPSLHASLVKMGVIR